MSSHADALRGCVGAASPAPLEQGSSSPPSPASPRPFLLERGAIYLSLRYGLGALVSLGNMLVLTWLIGPRDYGLFVTAIGLTSVPANLVRCGFDTYLVRCETPLRRASYNTAWTAILCFSVLAMLIGALAVPLLALWYRSRAFAPAYLATLLTIPLAGLAGPVTARLERALKFQAVAQIELAGQTLALVTGLSLALAGKGIWAPVTGQILWQSFGLLATLRASKFRPRLSLDRSELRRMMRFGAGYTAAQRSWQLRALVNPLIVGRFVGAEGVAFVGLAIRIAEGLGFLRVASARIAIASLARLQRTPAMLRASLHSALRSQVLVLGPLLASFALAGPWLIQHVIGARWMPSLRVYPLLAFAILVNSIYNLQAAALFVLGRQWTVLRAYAVHIAVLAIAAFLLVPRIGVAGYGFAEILACSAYPLLQVPLSRLVGDLPRSLWLFVLAFGIPLCSPWVNSAWSFFLWVPAGIVLSIQVATSYRSRSLRGIPDALVRG